VSKSLGRRLAVMPWTIWLIEPSKVRSIDATSAHLMRCGRRRQAICRSVQKHVTTSTGSTVRVAAGVLLILCGRVLAESCFSSPSTQHDLPF
jgi:hypothetical protein